MASVFRVEEYVKKEIIMKQVSSTSQAQKCRWCISIYKRIFRSCKLDTRPPLWSSGQSSWLQIRRPGFDSRHYQKKK
jgi:hypothetical protein